MKKNRNTRNLSACERRAEMTIQKTQATYTRTRGQRTLEMSRMGESKDPCWESRGIWEDRGSGSKISGFKFSDTSF